LLTPEYLNLIEFNDVVNIYEKLNIDITTDIIKRLLKTQEITEVSRKQLEILKETNGTDIFLETLENTSMLSAETKKAVKDLYLNMAKEDIKGYKELYEYRNKPFKLSDKQYKILNQGLKQTNKVLKNFTNTIAFQSKQAYVEAIDMAYIKVTTGAYDYQSAINDAVKELAKKGVTLKDKLGRNIQLEAAVRRNVLSGIQETANNINRDVEDYLGCDGYEVTAHIGARPTHAEAQGKQYAVKKEDSKKYVVDLWKDVEGLWKEYNCRHSYFGIILGISEPIYSKAELKEYKDAKVIYKGKEIPYYEAIQKQRQLENAIRREKRTIQILEKSEIDATNERSRLKQLQQKHTAFCKETGLEKDYNRMKVVTNKEKHSIIEIPQFYKKITKNKEQLYSKNEIKEIAKSTSRIANKYTKNISKWSGNIIESNRFITAKLWSCDIEVENYTSPHAILHEHLHAHSISYYNEEVYKKYRKIEETTVELLAKEISKKENIIDVKSDYDDWVENLTKINEKIQIEKDNLKFAQKLFNIPVTYRLEFLENKIQNYLVGKSIDEAIEINKLMEVLYD